MPEPDLLRQPETSTAPARGREPGLAATLAVVFAGALVLYLAGTVLRELRTNDEHRYVTVAREFVTNGDWWYCRLNGEEYVHKPPVFFWSIAFFRELGATWTAAGMLPSAIGAAFATVLTFDIARRLYGRVAAWAAALALVGMRDYYELATRANLDALLSAFTTLAAYGFVRAVLCDGDDRTRTRWTIVGFVGVALGILEKGPSAVAIPGSAVLVALLWDDRWSRIPWWRWVLAILVLLVPCEDYGISLPGSIALRALAFIGISGIWASQWGALRTWRWALAPIAILLPFAWTCAAAAQAPSGWTYVYEMAFGQAVMHAAGGVDKLQPWWFYAKVIPVKVLPWTILVPAAVWTWVRFRREDTKQADRFAMAWVVAPLVVMSISRAKRDVYLIPIYPAVALLIGRLAMTVAADEVRLRLRPVRWGLATFGVLGLLVGAACVVLGAAELAGADAVVAAVSRVWRQWREAGHVMPSYVHAALVVAGIGLAVWAVALLRARAFRAAARALVALTLFTTSLAALVYVPLGNALDSQRAFLEQVRARIGGAYLGDYGGGAFAPNWVCDRTVVDVVETRREAERIVETSKGPAYFVADRIRLERKGLPEGTTILMEDGRRGEDALVLIGRE